MEQIKLLPLLSGSLKDVFEKVYEKHNSKIAYEILAADALINEYNNNLWILDKPDEVAGKYRYLLPEFLKSINNLITDEARMLTFRPNEAMISYLPKDKTPVYTSDGIWSRENRQSSKPAKLIQKLLKTEYKCKEFEDFSNWIKNELLCSGEFKIVTGDDIVKYYDGDNYYKINGTLGNSCMRHSECADYFNIYKDCAKLLVCLKDDKVLGRAIIWEIGENTYMDRYYTCDDFLENAFIEYARDHKWCYRSNNSLLYTGEEQYWYTPDDNYTAVKFLELKIELPRDYDHFPYLDSFRYVNYDKTEISTIKKGASYTADDTEGELNKINFCTYTCVECGEEVNVCEDDDVPSDWAYSNYYDGYLCPDCARYVDFLDDYYSAKEEFVTVHIKENYDEELPLCYIEENLSFYIKIDNEWYNLYHEAVQFDDESGKYIIIKD